ncbi:hypothetical protein [Candidatus Thiodictyon syntrophicum]|uniref:hypothetical protein n=1 Tax=Candidatus Thiodictyon syntrophicum TaxID=1166950 RepID=UPI0012FD6E01|nr:hypothetical protein [Candidatus Thiodictyon syntrophicum]
MPSPSAVPTGPTVPLLATSPAPVRLDWCRRAAILPGKTLHLALALMALATAHRAPGVRLTRRTLTTPATMPCAAWRRRA